jgi:bifunctional non-homologous end joining protein LigD
MGKSGKSRSSSDQHIEPMLCTLVKEPPTDADYLFEMKWDGYRIISYVENGKVRMDSRSGLDYTSKYPPIAKALASLGHDVILDGEVVVFNAAGKPDFDALQLYNGHSTPIQYCVFDILALDGNDLMQMPLVNRKELLKALTAENKAFRYSESYEDGALLYKKSLEENLEGIVAKQKNSPYMAGARGNAWLKIPTRKRQEFVIGAWAESTTSRSFKSLLFGAYEDGKLMWIGRSGGGYKHQEMPAILSKLQQFEIKQSPFLNKILDVKGAVLHYVKPELVANFEFATWTKSGRIRKPATFLGFRYDKNPKDVVREIPEETPLAKELLTGEEPDTSDLLENEVNTPQIEVSTPETKVSTPEVKGLDTYLEKRQFNKTPEPKAGHAEGDKLIFVVQKHHASHLHYDFRLEMKGVLKSWAVPKGPSMNPADHRLAMAVEDHPYDYKDFEGIIPQGQYGGGTVIVWDQGTYEPAEKLKTKKDQEHWLLSHYNKEGLRIVLKGKKLKGEFELSRSREKGENYWLLRKVEDKFATTSDVSKKEKSVVSGMTIEQMESNKDAAVWTSNREGKAERPVEQDSGAAPEEQDSKPALKEKPTQSKTLQLAEDSNWKMILEEKISSEGDITLGGQQVHLTNIEKKLWKNVDKAALITYYNSVAEYILPHLKDRPLSLHIKNLSATAPGFYIKDMEGMEPEYSSIFSTQRKHKKKGKRYVIDYIVCNNLPTLIYLVNLGCIDINPWNSRTTDPLHPDFIAIDLDPSDNDFSKAVHTALAAKDYFSKLKLIAFVKTSGKTGIHMFIPCKGFTYPQARTLAEHICKEIHLLVPAITTIEVSVDHRGDKLFVDFSQNDEADTLASVYSVRPSKKPTVSTPLDWTEVTEELTPDQFTIFNIRERLEQKGDLFAGIRDTKVISTNTKILKALLSQGDA